MSNSLLTRVPMPVKLGVLLGTALLAAACASNSGNSSASSTPASTSTAAAGSGSTASASRLVITTHSSSLGTYLIDGSGRTVYLWVKDPTGKSVCSGACAGAWPPVTTTGPVAASGSAVASDLGTITRSDGAKQVTYDGHPLYYFVGDTSANMTAGQGSNGFGAKWWVVAPSGSGITTASASGSVGSSTSSTSTSTWA